MIGSLIKNTNIIYGLLLVTATFAQWRHIETNNNILLVAGALVFLFGIPHGAADTLIFRRISRYDSYIGWILFGLLYILMAATIYSVWLWNPPIFLGYLLFISVIHFGEDLHGVSHRWLKLSYGLAIVFLPALLWQSEVSKLYGFLVGTPMAVSFAHFSHLIAWISLANLAISVFAYRGILSHKSYALIAWPIITLVILEPLLGFALYFGLWHSRLHLKRLVGLRIMDREPMTILMVAAPLIITLIGAYYGFYKLGGINDSSFSRIIFVGLGSLTFPHLFMVYALGSLDKTRGFSLPQN